MIIFTIIRKTCPIRHMNHHTMNIWNITDMAQIFLAKRFCINHTNTPGNVSFIINQRIDIYVIQNLRRINMKGKKIIMIAALLIISVFILAACGSGIVETDTEENDANKQNKNNKRSPDSQ